MKRTQAFRIALTTAIAIATVSVSVIGGLPVRVAAQDDPSSTGTATEAPAATVDGAAMANPEVTAEPAAESSDAVTPQRADLLWWTPNTSTSFSISSNPTVTVRVSSNEGDFDLSTARYYLIDKNGVIQPSQSATATPVGDNSTVDLSANVGNVATGWKIVFQIRTVTNVLTESPVHSLVRSTSSYLPLIFRNSGATTIPNTITTTGANACDALVNRRGGPLGPWVNYVVQNTSTESWFFTFNPLPNATIVVSLTNYTNVQGQLQVFREQAGCGALAPLLGFGTNPNPIVTVSGLPAGNLYFRVISGAGQPAPLPYIINWAYAGGSGPFEPNNNPCEATLLQAGTQYTTFSDDQYDFFAMNITGTGQIQVLVQGFTIGLAQIQVRTPLKPGFFCPGNGADPINSTDRIDPFGVVPQGGGDVLVTVFIPNPGLYYIRVSLPPNVPGNGQPYRIRWNYAGAIGGDTAGPIFTTNPNQPPSCNPAVPNSGCQPDLPGNVNEGGQFTFYWFGMANIPGGYDQLQMRIRDDIVLDGCPKNVFPSDATLVDPQGFGRVWGNVGTTASRGSITFTFRKHGSYAVAFRAMRGGQQVFFDEKPLRVGCGFFGKSFEPTFDARGLVMSDVAAEFVNEPMRPIAVFTEDTPPDAPPHP